MSNFASISHVFENVRSIQVIKHKFNDKPIERIMRAAARLFQCLDRTDPAQAEISRRLWFFRASVVSAVLPFDSPLLGLKKQMAELVQVSRGLPDASPFIDTLISALDDLLETGNNHKRDWLLQALSETGNNGKTGVFYALAWGSPPGWPSEALPELGRLLKGQVLIGSRKDLRSSVFTRIILPCSGINASRLLMTELFFSGRAGTVDILLYPDERFHIPRRLALPDTGLFKSRLKKLTPDERTAEPADVAADTVDDWANQAFWENIHGAARHGGANLVAAHYALFGDGTGTFLPAGGRVHVIPEDGIVSDETDLKMIRVESICEGDNVVLRVGDPGFLLDKASDRIMSRSGEEDLETIATDWKDALDALLVTCSGEEISADLMQLGVHVSPASILQWAGPEVLGPKSEKVFRELIMLLGNRRKIVMTGDNLESYASSRWNRLQELRGVRQKAGRLVTQDLLKTLIDQLNHGLAPLAERSNVRLTGNGSVELLILKVSSMDQITAFVPPSRLCRLDDLRGNRWLV